MPETLTNGQGVECADCGVVTETNDVTINCEACDGPNMNPVVIADCSSPEDCTDEYHHWGYHKHIIEGMVEEVAPE